MRLTELLLKNIPYRFRGKYRIVKDPKFIDLLRLRHDLEREEKNMLYLRHPYLTAEQSNSHMKDIREPKLPMGEVNRMKRNEKYNKKITIADRLYHLRVNESWD